MKLEHNWTIENNLLPDSEKIFHCYFSPSLALMGYKILQAIKHKCPTLNCFRCVSGSKFFQELQQDHQRLLEPLMVLSESGKVFKVSGSGIVAGPWLQNDFFPDFKNIFFALFSIYKIYVSMIATRAGHFRYFFIFSLIKNDFLHFL